MTAGLELALLPALGGKLISLRRPGGAEVLLRPPERPWRPAIHGAPFQEYDASGFDECLPTVAPCPHPLNTMLPCLPDHGDLWSLPARVSTSETGIRLESTCRSLPLALVRRLSSRGGVLRIDYRLESRAPVLLPWLWSAHPLLAVSPGSRIHLPPGTSALRLEWASDGRFGEIGCEVSWPGPIGSELDRIVGHQAGWAAKFFAPAGDGTCAFWNAETDETVRFRFDPILLPHLGVWICQGGWPGGGRTGHCTVAVEPCTAPCDSLETHLRSGNCPVIEPGGCREWWLELELKSGVKTPETQ